MNACIVKGKHLAKMLVRTYQWCRMMSRVPTEQRMGILPEDKFMVPFVPFTHITMDFTNIIKQRLGSLLLPEHETSLNGRGD